MNGMVSESIGGRFVLGLGARKQTAMAIRTQKTQASTMLAELFRPPGHCHDAKSVLGNAMAALRCAELMKSGQCWGGRALASYYVHHALMLYPSPPRTSLRTPGPPHPHFGETSIMIRYLRWKIEGDGQSRRMLRNRGGPL